MGSLRESYLESIKTNISQIVKNIPIYPPDEQVLLVEFVTVLEACEVNTSEKRKHFFHLVAEYIKRHYEDEAYIELPFMWFALDYLNIANRVLNVTGFHPDDFYLYLNKHLRKNPEAQGVSELVKGNVPLADLRWETLQYACNKFPVPLNSDEVQAIEISYSHVTNTGLRALSQQSMIEAITNQITTPRFSRRLRNLYTLLNAQWNLRLFPPAFGLDRLYFQFQLSEGITLNEVLGHKEDLNTTLTATDIYQAETPQIYSGFILIPSRLLVDMKTYLQRCHDKKQITLFEVTKVHQIQISRAMTLYQMGEGWRNLTSTEKSTIKQVLKTSRPPRGYEPPPYYATPIFNTEWNYKGDDKLSLPAGYIDLYCKMRSSFSFTDLPTSLYSQQSKRNFTKKERQLLTYLYHRKVLHVNFDPIRLGSDFSLDIYQVQLPPNVKSNNIQILLSYLPVVNVYNTETTTFMMVVLTPDLVQWFNQDLEWSIQSVRFNYERKALRRNWYDTEATEWRTPLLLKDFEN